MLKRFGPQQAEDSFWRGGGWLVIQRTGSSYSIAILINYEDTITQKVAAYGDAYMTLRPQDEVACTYGVNLKPLVDATSTRIDVFRGQEKKLLPKRSRKKRRRDAKQR